MVTEPMLLKVMVDLVVEVKNRMVLVVLEPLDKDMLEEAQYVEVVFQGKEMVVVEVVVLLL